MRVLIKNGTVIDPINNINDRLDVLIESNKVSLVKKNIKADADHVIDAKGYIVSPGFVDLHSNFCDPGVTVREDLKTGSLAAAKGGFTHVVLGTDNKPSPSECNVIEYIKKYAQIMPVNIFPSAAITVDRMGEEIADINFLYNHGAIAFYDGLKSIINKDILEKAMLKIKNLDKVISLYSEDLNDMNENIELAKYIGVKLDLAYVSTSDEIDVVANAKKNNAKIYAEVQALNIILNNKAETKYGSNAKVLPPLSSETDRKAIIKALKNGIIDIISSNHVPVEEPDKNLKFKNAVPGAIGLETLLGICGSKLADSTLDWMEIIEKISSNPAKLYELDKNGAGSITVGTNANITIFDPNEKWKFREDNIVSKSKNSPLIGTELKAKVKYTICNGKLIYKDIDVK